MKKLLLPAILASAMVVAADDWYSVSLEKFKKVEITSTSQIVLEQAAPNWDIPIKVNGLVDTACMSKRIVLTPPSGFLNPWLSLILAGQSTGKNLWVSGSCSANIITISTAPNNRIMLE